MNRRFAVSLLSTLLYVQGVLCFAGLAAALLNNHDGASGSIAAALVSGVPGALG